ncbi:MAG: hypothetical protein IT329_15620 [Caldilineaceae bacterium]|nr:hypothetical protein [Caldilineaceae bacterium]
MNHATRITVSTIGVLAALAGIEHGVGEILQGAVAPAGVAIQSWPDSALFRDLNGEPAMTLIPNLRSTGVLAVIFSLIFLVWVIFFVDRPKGGLALIALSLIMLLVGAGFGPPLLGFILGTAATRIHAPLTGWGRLLSSDAQTLLAKLWPWSLAVCVVVWLLLFPGSLLIALAGVNGAAWVGTLTLLAFSLLFLTLVAGFARDLHRQQAAQQMPANA